MLFGSRSIKSREGLDLEFLAQRIEHLTTDQKVGNSNPFARTIFRFSLGNLNLCIKRKLGEVNH